MTTALAFLILSCVAESSATPQPTRTPGPPTSTPGPSPVPFNSYGETLIDIPYCSVDPTSQTMDMYFPESGGPWPVLVYVHGGGWRAGDKSDAILFADRMKIQGYLVVSINYRLYPVGTFPAMIEDVKCAIRSLRAHAVQYNLDPERIAAVGPSAGGHLVSLLGTSDESAGWDVGEYLDQSSRVRAVIPIAAVTDLTREFRNANIETIKQVGFGEDNVLQASPVTHVTPDDSPFLLIHGNQDTTVPLEQSELLYERLVEMNVPAELVIVKNAGHSPIEPGGPAEPTLEEIYQIITDFLAKYLAQ